jgi:uncharacterized protein with NRDE domain
MCLIAWDWQPGPDPCLLLIGNRDEFFARPTQILHPWNDSPLLAGCDLQAGGTWLGLNRKNYRLAAVTNFRSPNSNLPSSTAKSRGTLVQEFLESDASSASFLNQLKKVSHLFLPFNLLLNDGEKMLGFESRSNQIIEIKPGISAVSNAGFDTPWPKLTQLKRQLMAYMQANNHSAELNNSLQIDQLLQMLANQKLAADSELPQTGISIERERALSGVFVNMPDYGTRASSLINMRQASACFIERSYMYGQIIGTDVRYSFSHSVNEAQS